MPEEVQAAPVVEAAPVAAEPSTPSALAETAAPAAVDPSDAIYDAAVQDLLGSDEDETQPIQSAAETPAATPAPTAQAVVMTTSEEQALRRAGLEPEDWAGWDRTKIEGRVKKLHESFASHDRIASELDRLKKAAPEVKAPEPQKPAADLSKSRLKDIRQKLVETYDEEITPLLDVIDGIDAERQSLAQQAEVLPVLTAALGEMVFDQILDSLKKDYPSLEKPESRAKMEERFWQEWRTGAYNKPGASFRQQMRDAASNAAKVVFAGTTELQAAANLVNGNRGRLAAQPRIPTGSPRPQQPRSKGDQIYDDAFKEHLAPQL